MTSSRLLFALVVATTALLGVAHAADPETLLVIKNHRFEPAELKVPAGQRIKLVVHNQDATPEEFESHSLNREKIVPGGAKVTIYIGPITSGRYEFYGTRFTPSCSRLRVEVEGVGKLMTVWRSLPAFGVIGHCAAGDGACDVLAGCD